MLKGKKNIRGLCVLTALMMIFLQVGVYGSSSITINGGDLVFNVSSIPGVPTEGVGLIADSTAAFDSVMVDADQPAPSSYSRDYIRVDDNTGTNNGWIVKVSAQQLVCNNITDPTTPGSTFTMSIPGNTIITANSVGTLSAINDSLLDGVSVTEDVYTPVDTTGIMMTTAAVGHGAGSYYAQPEYKLTIPHYVPAGSTISNISDANSPLKDVTDVTKLGMFAGTYDFTLTYNLSASPQE